MLDLRAGDGLHAGARTFDFLRELLLQPRRRDDDTFGDATDGQDHIDRLRGVEDEHALNPGLKAWGFDLENVSSGRDGDGVRAVGHRVAVCGVAAPVPAAVTVTVAPPTAPP